MRDVVIAAAAAVILTLIVTCAVFKRRERIMKSFIVSQAAEIRRLRSRLNGMRGFRDALIEYKTAGLQDQVRTLKRQVINKDIANHRLLNCLRQRGGLDEQSRDCFGLGA